MSTFNTTLRINLDSSKVQRGLHAMRAGFADVGRYAKGAFIGATAAVAALGAATAVYFNRFRESMDRIGKLATRLEEGPETIQRMGLAARLAGMDTETLVRGMQQLNRSVYDAQDGLSTYVRGFERLGVRSEDFLNLRMEDRLMLLARAYEEAGDKGLFLAGVEQLMGRAGKEMGQLLAQGAGSLQQTLEGTAVVSGRTVRNVERLNDSLERMKASFAAGFGQGVSGALEGLAARSEDFEEVFARIGERAGVVMSAAMAGNLEPLQRDLTQMFEELGARLAGAMSYGVKKGASTLGAGFLEMHERAFDALARVDVTGQSRRAADMLGAGAEALRGGGGNGMQYEIEGFREAMDLDRKAQLNELERLREKQEEVRQAAMEQVREQRRLYNALVGNREGFAL